MGGTPGLFAGGHKFFVNPVPLISTSPFCRRAATDLPPRRRSRAPALRRIFVVMSIRSELHKAAYQARGSYKTMANRSAVVDRFANYLRDENIQIRHISQVNTRYLENYIRAGSERGISPRTLQNEASALRTTLRAAGRDKLADNLNNKTLGISGASRAGTKTAMTPERYTEIRQGVVAKDAGVAACIELQWTLGLRQKEAVMSVKSLRSWETALRDGKSIRVIFGTKGGRPRDVGPSDRDRALAAVRAAMALANKQNGRIIDKPNLKSALGRYSRVLHSAGATGNSGGPPLRYRFAQAPPPPYAPARYRRV